MTKLTKKAKKLALKCDSLAKRTAAEYMRIEAQKIDQRARLNALLHLHASGKLKGTIIGGMIDRDDWPDRVTAAMFEEEGEK
jgi:hypothetical protein